MSRMGLTFYAVSSRRSFTTSAPAAAVPRRRTSCPLLVPRSGSNTTLCGLLFYPCFTHLKPSKGLVISLLSNSVKTVNPGEPIASAAAFLCVSPLPSLSGPLPEHAVHDLRAVPAREVVERVLVAAAPAAERRRRPAAQFHRTVGSDGRTPLLVVLRQARVPQLIRIVGRRDDVL